MPRSKLTKYELLVKGITDHAVKLKKKAKRGAIIKPKVFAFVGITVSFTINFTASATGCNKPLKPTTFGPFRCWIEPIIFLSAKVRNATETKIGKTIIKRLNIFSRIKYIINN